MRLKEEYKNTIEIERSEFICYLKKVFHEQEARDYINEIKKLHPDATHHCTAFIIGENNEIQRSSDDGEPSGTAGVPMLQALKNSDIQDICAVVVRYFGGIKLGAGGLVRAYTRSVAEAVSKAPKVEAVKGKVYSLSFSYDLIGKLDYLLKDCCMILDKQYEEQVTYKLYTTDEAIETKIQEWTSGQVHAKYLEERIIEVDIDR